MHALHSPRRVRAKLPKFWSVRWCVSRRIQYFISNAGFGSAGVLFGSCPCNQKAAHRHCSCKQAWLLTLTKLCRLNKTPVPQRANPCVVSRTIVDNDDNVFLVFLEPPPSRSRPMTATCRCSAPACALTARNTHGDTHTHTPPRPRTHTHTHTHTLRAHKGTCSNTHMHGRTGTKHDALQLLIRTPIHCLHHCAKL